MRNTIILVSLGAISFNGQAFHRFTKPIVSSLAAVSATCLVATRCQPLEEKAKAKCLQYMRHPYFVEQTRFDSDELTNLHADAVPLVETVTTIKLAQRTKRSSAPMLMVHLANVEFMYECLFKESPAFQREFDRPSSRYTNDYLKKAYEQHLLKQLTETARVATVEELAVIRALDKEKPDAISASTLKTIKESAGWTARLKSKLI